MLVSYVTRAPSKLHCRWEGWVQVISRVKNNDAMHEYDVSRFKHFLVTPGVNVKELAADMEEEEVAESRDHRGNPKKRRDMEFLVKWTDAEQTWEPWEQVRKIAFVEEYILSHPDAKLRFLLPKDVRV